MNFFKKLFGKKEKPEPPKTIPPNNEYFPNYSDIVDDLYSPFTVGVVYNNRDTKKQSEDD